jgi:hypothetical protein
VYYRENNCYWTPKGYRDRDTVWEYYFEPVIPNYPVSCIPVHIRDLISTKPPIRTELGYFADELAFVSNNPGGHIKFDGERLKGTKEEGHSDKLRRTASGIIRTHVRPRAYITERVDCFFDEHLAGRFVIGVHIRGTDALVDPRRKLKESRINFKRYFATIEQLLRQQPDACIFVASDTQLSVDRMRERFGNRVVACDSIRHESGELAGMGPTGRIMPAYLTGDSDRAARNGEEAVIEYLLLSRCNFLVHNGSSIPHTVLLTAPGMPASNMMAAPSYLHRLGTNWRRRAANLHHALLRRE